MAILKFDSKITEKQSDGTDTEWYRFAITGGGVFPHAVQLDFAGYTWMFEFYIIPGRYGDKLITHVMKKGEDQGFIPVLDYNIQTGVQLTIDNAIRIYGFNIKPNLQDNYDHTTVRGKYFIALAEVL